MISTRSRSSSYHRSLEMLPYSLAAPICRVPAAGMCV